ncbi:family 43 glycosylhydrolase [soil metagenome]
MVSLLLMLAATYTNPVIDANRPDPGVLRAEGAFWMVHTTGGPKEGWPLYRSPDLVHWTFVKHLLEEGVNKPAWMKDHFWAPEIHKIGPSRYLATGTAWNSESKTLCVGLAVADHIEGPYKVGDKPIVQDPVSVLDTNIFQEGEKIYLLWKRDEHVGNGIDGTIRMRQLHKTGMAFEPGSQEVVLLKGHADAKEPEAVWEKGLVEAPWLVKHDGWYVLFYSGAFIDTSYALGAARSRKIEGPYERCPTNPILHSNQTWGGPGHGGFVEDDAGTLWHLYHARHQSKPDFGRVQMLDRVIWKKGWPSFPNGGTPTTKPQEAPKVAQN